MATTTSPPAIGRGDSASKDQLNTRMRRTDGQVRGIPGMVEDDRYRIDMLTQINSIQAAAGRLMRRG